MIKSVSYKRHRFPPEIIAHAVWLYFRFPLSLRCCWSAVFSSPTRQSALKFAPDYARRLRRNTPSRRDICSGASRRSERTLSSERRTFWICMPSPTALTGRSSALTSCRSSCSLTNALPNRWLPATLPGWTMSTGGKARPICSCALRPLAGWRYVEVTARRTNQDFAEQMRALGDDHYPDARSLRWFWTISAPTALPRPTCGGAPHREAAGVSLHAQIRQLAQHGRTAVRDPQPPMLGPVSSAPNGAPPRDRRLGSRAQQDQSQGALAI